jgi:hypothetical protein
MSDPRPDQILQVGLGFWASKTLLSAVEMQLFTELAKHPETLAELSARLGLHPRGANDFLDALVALGFLERRDGTYYNTPETDLFLDARKPSYIGGILEMANHRLYPFWGGLTTALRTGQPQNEAAHGGPDLFATLYADPERLRGFLKAMTGISHGANMTIARQFPSRTTNPPSTSAPRRATSSRRSRSPTRTSPASASTCPRSAPSSRTTSPPTASPVRVRFHPGSFFDAPIPSADVVMMGHILHDWDLPTKKMLIGKAYEALPSGGALIVYESIIDDDRSKNAFGLMMSLNMLIETPGGFDYTGADCAGWMQEAGFHSTRVEHLLGPESMVVGIK